MSGPKAYTMREMKGIVEYLVTGKAYGEIKGRKMWMDFANSSHTTRTWQSLKETFLKRILPDIQNPYYQLTRDQVCSFRQGVDVEAKERNNRLEILTVSEESINNEKKNNIELPSTSAEKCIEVEQTLGEKLKSAVITVRNRSSADTYIIEDETEARNSCDYQQVSKKTTRELLEDLGEPTKSLKECLDFEYSEPPTAVLEVLNDFETESEGSDGEPPMEIVEDIPENDDAGANEDTLVVEDSGNIESVEFIEEERIRVEGGMEVDIGPTFDHEIITEVISTDSHSYKWLEGRAHTEQKVPSEPESDKSVVLDTVADQNEDTNINESRGETELIIVEDSESPKEKSKENENQEPIDNNNQNSLNATADTNIPNNQELLNTSKSQRTSAKFDILAPLKDASRKRSTSPDKNLSKKMKLDGGIEAKINGDVTKDVTEVTQPSPNTEAIFEGLKNSNKPIEDSTMQDAQDINESPQIKNPCLKSVSLFEEQFNTTKYSDSDEDTPIPNNVEKIIQCTATAENDQSNAVNGSAPNGKRKEITDVPMEEEKKEVVKSNPSVEKKQRDNVETDPPDQTNKKITTEKKHDESIQIDSPVRQKTKIIKLTSNSDSDIQLTTPPDKRPKKTLQTKARTFGFVPGTSRPAALRRRSLRSRNRTKSQRSCTNEDKYWEDYLSELEESEDYVSPPRRNKNAGRKVKKPPSGHILSLGGEDGLYVIQGNKIMPLLKRGKIINFVTLNKLGESEEEEESIWQKRYIDERKKATILKRRLEEVEACNSRSKSPLPNPPILPNPPCNININTNADAKQPVQNKTETDINKPANMDNGSGVSIILSRNESRHVVNVQGRWPELLPVVENVMSMFYKDVATTSKPDVPIKEDKGERASPSLSITVQGTRNADDIEKDIFKEIEEQAKDISEEELGRSNVTKRKAGKPKKTPSTSSEQSEKTAKRPRLSKRGQLNSNDNVETETNIKEETGEKVAKPIDLTRLSDTSTVEDNVSNKLKEQVQDKLTQNDKTESATTKVSNTPKKQTQEKLAVNDKTNDKSIKNTVASTQPKKKAQEKLVVKDKTDNESVKMKVQSAETKKQAEDKLAVKDKTNKESVWSPSWPIETRVTRSKKSGNETDTSSTRTTTIKPSSKPSVSEDQVRYMFPPEPMSRRSSSKLTPNKTKSAENPHETSQGDLRNSVDSTQGYQDSDPSPAKVNITKRKRKTSVTVRKGKYVPRRKSLSRLSVHDISFNSSNSSYFVPKKSQSTLDSAIYKTESYEILMGNRKQFIKKLDAIDETNKIDNLGHFNAVSKVSSSTSDIVEPGSSSNVSLPLSPELSVVENLSISREMIQGDNHPTINETQANESVEGEIYNQYLISDVDVSIPLMQQDCELLTRGPAKRKMKKQKSPIKVSEFLSKVSTVNMSVNNVLSDSLDRKLRDLLLESAKKISNCNKENHMDVDESNVEPKKTRGKKRSSTPRKKAGTKQIKPAMGPVIDEHMESCSHGGRNSCPPVITFIPLDENANNSADVQLKAKPKPKQKVKKDTIKVKIQRPKKSKKGAKIPETSVANTSQLSVHTDSGINETASISEVFLQGSDSVELIHNHSETCLQTNECIGNSIEFVENSVSESVISVNSTASLESELLKVMEDVEMLSGEYRSRNAQDLSGEKSSGEIFGTPTGTVYHSPMASNCSLLTDDLSNETPIPSAKWYLFSEDDTNNTNMRLEQMTSNARVSNLSANLKQLFPITCAVPDLSTISEMSKENEGSRKAFDSDSDTRSSHCQSLL